MRCEVPTTPLAATPACSGKCAGGACGGVPRVWVLAVCEGGVALFEKKAEELVALSLSGEGDVVSAASALQICCSFLEKSAQNGAFQQLILVGGASDIAWVQALLPLSVARYVMAEIRYPLMAAWFRQSSDWAQLSQALRPLFPH